MAVVCPECDNPLTIDVEDAEEGEKMVCDECGVELEIVSLDPLEVAPIEEGSYHDEAETLVPEDDEE